MSESAFYRPLACTVTAADLAVFLHYFPLACEASETNRPFMVTITVLLFALGKSLANLWEAAWRSSRPKAPTTIPPAPQLSMVASEGEHHV